MLRERPQSPDRLRCPWCQGEGAGDRWVTCERDNTPIHAACVGEFGICPICREPVDAGTASAATSRTTRRQIVIGRSDLASPSAPRSITDVVAVPEDVRQWLATVRRDYQSTFLRTGVLAAWGAGTLLGVGTMALFSPLLTLGALMVAGVVAALLHANQGRPRASVWIPVDVAPTRELEAIAQELAEGDASALREHAEHARALSTARARRREHERLEAGRLDHHRDALEEGTPIEDAQRIRGVGDGITSTLRAYGVGNLADLRRRGTAEGIPQIGPKRASLLQTWALDRATAIDRLLRAGNFAGRADLDRRFDEQLAPVREAAERTARDANERLERVRSWVRARPDVVARLRRATGRGNA